ncbi:MAG: nuclear transport factor 2 family protein [Actinomycetota bacterium]
MTDAPRRPAATPDDLVEIEAIKRLKHLYVRLLDLKRWDELGDLFVPDATSAYSDGKYSFQGRDAILAFLRQALASPNVLTSHRVQQPEIDLAGPDTAVGVWALDDVVILVEHATTVRGAGFYRDE